MKYRAARNALALLAADVELPFATHNDKLLQLLAPQFENQLKEGRTKQTILKQVKWVLEKAALRQSARPPHGRQRTRHE